MSTRREMSTRACLVLALTLASAAWADESGKAASSPAERGKTWTIATDDTKLTVGANQEGQLCLYELSSPAAAWNWTAEPSVFPLVK
ncbi:MAG: hypothetical protein ABR915_22310, partial [Thermoguttaceae bacterium]